MRSFANLKLTIPTIVAVLLTGGLAYAADNAPSNTLTKKEKTDGWKLLFDGKSVEGWNSWKTKQPLKLGQWVIEDGRSEVISVTDAAAMIELLHDDEIVRRIPLVLVRGELNRVR